MVKKESAKDRILQVAEDLFYREGIRAVGIDRIIAESGVAKASFYRSFATKDDLIAEYVEQKHVRSMGRIEEAKSRHPGDPIAQLIYLFRETAERMRQPNFRGCPYINTLVEFPDPTHPAHLRVIESRREVWGLVREIAREAGARDPAALAEQLQMLYSGAMVIAYMKKSAFNCEHFYNAALTLIANEVPNFELPESRAGNAGE